jgi:hypothetical protein
MSLKNDLYITKTDWLPKKCVKQTRMCLEGV